MRGGSLLRPIACAAVFVSLNNSSIVSYCCYTKILRLEPRLKFKVRGREIGRARQTFQSGKCHTFLGSTILGVLGEKFQQVIIVENDESDS